MRINRKKKRSRETMMDSGIMRRSSRIGRKNKKQKRQLWQRGERKSRMGNGVGKTRIKV